ncbi:putative bifunctional diguanylate cyclase/phosphodiesterase [Porticoccus sp.]|uniref:putative bifunctional diguanylate cyclase/phosphodiesterase n=1 Tax=Porticoccus sp. TaxID=2024853 RepID=UPI003F69D6B7
MLNSYRIRLVIAFVVVLMLVQLATAVFVLNATHREQMLQQQQTLDVGINVFREVLANRSLQLNNSLSVLSADFGFKRAIATGESDTILSVLEDHGNRIGADAAILLSPEGRLISSSIADLGEEDIEVLSELTASMNDGSAARILSFDNASYQFVMQPVKAPTLIAWVGMGFVMDSQVAQQAKAITGVEVSFINKDGNGRFAVESTLGTTSQSALLSQLSMLPELSVEAAEGFPEHYLSYALKLNGKAADKWVVLHLSSLRWEQNYEHLRNSMLSIFPGTLALSLLVAAWLSGSLTLPVHTLVEFARLIGQGQNPPPIKGAPAELAVLADTLTVMRDNTEARERDLIYQSTHDSLTGLANRFAAKRMLQEAGDSLSGTLVLLDIKHFRHINDMIGFANGDSLLVMFARRLETITPAADFLARLDGDAFLLLYKSGITETLLSRAIDQLEAPFSIQDSNISLKIRAGMLSLAEYGGTVGVLLRRIEIALMQACLNDTRIVAYRSGQDEKYQRELTIINQLERGLEQGQFYLVFQPKVDIQSNVCKGAEALIRWNHPELGPIRPDEFIMLAEHTDNIDLISQWVLRQAMDQLVAWQNEGLGLKLAVNLSPRDLVNEALPGQIAQMLDARGLASELLAIEVTEGAVMRDPITAVGVLQKFRDLGLSIAIDDFGTGHSSLAYLKMLPVDEVKIDRSFIKDMLTNTHDAMIVETSIALTHSLGFSVTAEGVEERQTIDVLRQQGCDVVQGYVYSRPLEARDFYHWYVKFNQQDGVSPPT